MTLLDMTTTNFRPLLPRTAIKEIHEEIGKVVSYRQVQRILGGKCEDAHGIIDIAIKKIAEHKKKIEARRKKMEGLLSESSPLKPNNS